MEINERSQARLMFVCSPVTAIQRWLATVCSFDSSPLFNGAPGGPWSHLLSFAGCRGLQTAVFVA
jgi:hypothetical protein